MAREFNTENVQRIVQSIKKDYVEAGYSEAQQNDLESSLYSAITAILWLQGHSVLKVSAMLVPHAAAILKTQDAIDRATGLEATIAEEFAY